MKFLSSVWECPKCGHSGIEKVVTTFLNHYQCSVCGHVVCTDTSNGGLIRFLTDRKRQAAWEQEAREAWKEEEIGDVNKAEIKGRQSNEV